MQIFLKHIKYFGCLFIALLQLGNLLAQENTATSKKLLLRDSLDFIDNKVNINSTANEFSPIYFNKGLLYISNKPIKGQKIVFNKIYWVPDSLILNRNSKVSNDKQYAIYLRSNNDFTPPTSNDNDILYNYTLIRDKTNSNKVESNFSDFTTDQAFAYNDSIKSIVYVVPSSKRYNGKKKWELWQAKIINGRILNKKKIEFKGAAADYLYPYLSSNADTLFFASNRKESLGGYDLFYVKRNGEGWAAIPIPVDFVNSSADELSPTLVNDTLLFSSNRQGGLGGYDVYSYVLNKNAAVVNLGYPMNTISDELSLSKIDNNYFLTTNRHGDFDILGVAYIPVFYQINGVLKYKNDSSLASNQLLYLKDVDEGKLMDSLVTDSLARYHFIGKPNRNYLVSTFTEDKALENFTIQTYPNQKNFDYVSNLKGRSPKQIKDSIDALNSIAEAKIKDSIIANDLRQKYIVRYGFDKKVLSEKEKLVLDSLIIKLSKVPNTYVIIGAFTDCVGSYKYNYQLSVKRAKYVVNYLIKNGLDKDRIVSNGYSKQYTLSPCLTKYSKSNQQNSRRAEILLSETKNTNWASLNKLKGNAYYVNINSNELKLINKVLTNKPMLMAKNKQVTEAKPLIAAEQKATKVKVEQLSKSIQEALVKAKALVAANELKLKDSIKQAVAIMASQAKKEQLLKAKLERIQLDSIKAANVTVANQAKKEAQQLAMANQLKIKDSIRTVNATLAKQALAQKLEAQQLAKMKAAEIALASAKEFKFKDSIKKAAIALALNAKMEKQLQMNLERLKKDSIRKAAITASLNAKKEKLIKAKLERIRLDSLAQVKIKADIDLIAQVSASRKRAKDSIAEAKLKSFTAKAAELEEADLTKEEILKSLETLANLKKEQERIVEYLTKRINKKPIYIFVSSDSVDIEIYDNGIHDRDSVSIIYNKRIVVDRVELQVNKPIKFKLKVDKDSKNNELVFVAENLGSEPPNTGVMFITDKPGHRQQVVLSTDMTHNEVVYFIRIAKQ
jgi:outer membrane protein OmpA-like peptidoglycan-associated protein